MARKRLAVLLLVRSLSRRLATKRPQFKVLWPVVVGDAVLVVYLLMWFEITPEDLLHDDPVFQHVSPRCPD
jgi:hypothetical protein